MLRDLDELFGIPEEGNLDTGCFLGGPCGIGILKEGEDTGFLLSTRYEVLNRDGKKIGSLSLAGNHILDLEGRRTGYFVGVTSLRKIFYLSNLDERDKLAS